MRLACPMRWSAGLSRLFLDNTAGSASWLDAREPSQGGRPDTEEVRSGDGPLSARVRPSSPKRDCGRRTTSTGGKAPTNVHTKSHLTLETTTDTPVRNQGKAEPARPDAGHPLQGAGSHCGSFPDPENRRNDPGRQRDQRSSSSRQSAQIRQIGQPDFRAVNLPAACSNSAAERPEAYGRWQTVLATA